VGTAEHQADLLSRLRRQSSKNSSGSTATTTSTTTDTEPPLSFVLTEVEQQVLQRGRNAGTKTNHRRSNPVAYQDATALEALLGYLYLSNRPRCTQLLQWLQYELEQL
jgi:23S rRNA maturation mini-RNase III